MTVSSVWETTLKEKHKLYLPLTYLGKHYDCLNWSYSDSHLMFYTHRHPSLLVTGLIFYDTKVTVMNRVLNATVQRTADHAAPEITLDPLEIVGGMYSFNCLHHPVYTIMPGYLETFFYVLHLVFFVCFFYV